MDHLNLLLEIASLKASELLRELQLYCNSQSPAAEATYGTGPRCAMVSKLKESYAKFEGIETLIRRVYLHDDELGGYCRVGWVVSGEVERCMLCSGRFSLMRMRHHCRACGNVICGLCAPSKVFIEELAFAGPQLVCTQCDHGQEFVPITPNSDLGIANYVSLSRGIDVDLSEKIMQPHFVLRMRRRDHCSTRVVVNLGCSIAIPNLDILAESAEDGWSDPSEAKASMSVSKKSATSKGESSVETSNVSSSNSVVGKYDQQADTRRRQQDERRRRRRLLHMVGAPRMVSKDNIISYNVAVCPKTIPQNHDNFDNPAIRELFAQTVSFVQRCCFEPNLGPYKVDTQAVYHNPQLSLTENECLSSKLLLQSVEEETPAIFLAEPVPLLVPSYAEAAFRLDPQIAVTRKDEQAFHAQQARSPGRRRRSTLPPQASQPHSQSALSVTSQKAPPHELIPENLLKLTMDNDDYDDDYVSSVGDYSQSVSGKRRASSTSALTAPAPAVKREYSYMFDEEDRRKVHQPSYSNRRTFSGMIATTPILRSFSGLKGAGSDSRSPQNFNSSSGNSSGTSTPLSSSNREPDSSSPQASSDKVRPPPPASSFQNTLHAITEDLETLLGMPSESESCRHGLGSTQPYFCLDPSDNLVGVGVQSDLLHMASGSAKNGQQSITEEMMLYVKHKSLRADDIPDVIAAAAKTPATLLGWQVVILRRDQSRIGMAVITGIRKNSKRQTEYRLSSPAYPDCWLRLRRSDKKTGADFVPFRRVITGPQLRKLFGAAA